MEKQPVDELFARKLRDAEAKVGPDVFNQLQQRISTTPLVAPVRRRPLAIWWYISSAACILVGIWFIVAPGITKQQVSEAIVKKQVTTHGKTGMNLTVKAVNRSEVKRSKYEAVDSKMSSVFTEETYLAHEPESKQASKEEAPTQSQETGERAAEAYLVKVQPSAINPLPVADIKQVSIPQKKTAERIVILTINEPPVENNLAIGKEDATPSNSKVQPNGLLGLVEKLKQLKNGELLARASPVSVQPNQKSRFGRVLNDVKESLKNETILD